MRPAPPQLASSRGVTRSPPMETLSLPPDITEPLIERTSDKSTWRIPNFIKELLRLQDEELAPTRLEMRAPRTPLPRPPEAEYPSRAFAFHIPESSR